MIRGALEPTVLNYDGKDFYDPVLLTPLIVKCWQSLPSPPITAERLLKFKEVECLDNVVIRKKDILNKLRGRRELKAYEIVSQMKGTLVPEALLTAVETVDEQIEALNKEVQK